MQRAGKTVREKNVELGSVERLLLTELFPYLSNVVVKEIQDKVVVLTVHENVVINGAGLEISSLMSPNMEEAD